MANEIERRRWNDEQQVRSWPKRERFTDRVLPYVVAALNPTAGECVLDIGSGGGKLSLAIVESVGPGGRVVGADISAGMVAWATDRAATAGAKNLSFVVADVQSETVPGRPFDAATSQFGVMFFDEPVTAFTNIRRQLKPGGRITFACWQSGQHNAWHSGTVLGRFVAPPPELPRVTDRPILPRRATQNAEAVVGCRVRRHHTDTEAARRAHARRLNLR